MGEGGGGRDLDFKFDLGKSTLAACKIDKPCLPSEKLRGWLIVAVQCKAFNSGRGRALTYTAIDFENKGR